MWRQLVRTIIAGGKNDRCRAAITENALLPSAYIDNA